MPIEVFCESCRRKLRVPDTAAGKRIKCPKCQGVINVPGGEVAPVAKAAVPEPTRETTPAKRASKSSQVVNVGASKSRLVKPAEQWYVQTEEGEQYGPVSRQELDQWHTEGRLTADTQLLLEGSPQWQWASDVYSDLGGQHPASDSGLPDFGAMAAPKSGSSSGPFDFSSTSTATTSSVTSRTKSKGKRAGKKGGGSPHIDYIAMVEYVMGGLGIFGGLIAILMMSSMAAAISATNEPGADAAAGVIGTIGVVAGVLAMVISCVWFAAAYGLQQRAGWGRILTLVLGVLTALSFSPLHIAFAVWAFIVLTDKDNAAVFR